nr:hypothetical protein [Human alphaherpesvirus 2]
MFPPALTGGPAPGSLLRVRGSRASVWCPRGRRGFFLSARQAALMGGRPPG